MPNNNRTDSPLEAIVDVTDPGIAEAFKILGNETRLATLIVLWDARDPWDPHDGLSFSEIYERIDVGDSGQFNYHLDKLVPHFVEETEDGYRLTYPQYLTKVRY